MPISPDIYEYYRQLYELLDRKPTQILCRLIPRRTRPSGVGLACYTGA